MPTPTLTFTRACAVCIAHSVAIQRNANFNTRSFIADPPSQARVAGARGWLFRVRFSGPESRVRMCLLRVGHGRVKRREGIEHRLAAVGIRLGDLVPRLKVLHRGL